MKLKKEKKMKRNMLMLLAAALLLVVAGCKKDDKNPNGEKMIFNAGFDKGGAKTEINGYGLSWNKDDVVSINGGDFIADKSGPYTNLVGGQVEKIDGLYKAYFPASIVDKETGVLTLPATQTYNGNNLSEVNPMYAQSTTTSLTFSSICAVMNLKLTGDKTVKEIRVTADQPLSGEFEVVEDGGIFKADMKGVDGDVILNCGEGVSISETADFYVTLPAGAYTSLQFNVVATDNQVAFIELTDATLMANTLNDLTRTPEFEDPVMPCSVNITGGCVDCSYTISGTVAFTEGSYACEFGIVYSDTDQTPTIDEGATQIIAHTFDDDPISGMVNFSVDISELPEDVMYYVRAYAIIEQGTIYSPETEVQTVTYTTPKPLPSTWSNGKNPHQFTVGDDNKVVYFSQGNLQYIGSAATPYWQFAENQLVILGNNGQGSASQNFDRDYFGWGTSGWNNGNQFYQPYDIDDTDSKTYGPKNGDNYNLSLTGDYAHADWGVHNPIRNGGNQPGMWRTLSGDEWKYLIKTRQNASNLWGVGTVGNCSKGLIILPDDWSLPAGLSFNSGISSAGYNHNSYSHTQWAEMEAAGAVFLPAAGFRQNTGFYQVGLTGMYWSSSATPSSINSSYAARLTFLDFDIFPENHNNRFGGLSVRLVSDNLIDDMEK